MLEFNFDEVLMKTYIEIDLRIPNVENKHCLFIRFMRLFMSAFEFRALLTSLFSRSVMNSHLSSNYTNRR